MMRVLYVAPRFHTNQIPIIRGWVKNGDQVLFISQFSGAVEDYTDLQPVVLGYSKLFEWSMYLYKKAVRRLSEKQEFDIRIKAGFPPFFRLLHIISGFSPDLVIMRERSLYNIPVYLICRVRHIKSILYNQSPLWDHANRDQGLGHKILMAMLPRQRMTPVYGNPDDDGCVLMKNSCFVPFVAEPFLERAEETYCQDGKIRLLCVGRYEKRKRLFMLVKALQEFLSQGRIILEITGEAVDGEQKAYLAALQKHIDEMGLSSQVKLRKNLSRRQVFDLYCKADIFILPSTRERASIAQLEAMSCSLPVICSDTNGSACYVRHGINGYLFQDDSEEDLRAKAGYLISHPDLISQMGHAGYQMVKEQYSFANYYHGVRSL